MQAACTARMQNHAISQDNGNLVTGKVSGDLPIEGPSFDRSFEPPHRMDIEGIGSFFISQVSPSHHPKIHLGAHASSIEQSSSFVDRAVMNVRVRLEKNPQEQEAPLQVQEDEEQKAELSGQEEVQQEQGGEQKVFSDHLLSQLVPSDALEGSRVRISSLFDYAKHQLGDSDQIKLCEWCLNVIDEMESASHASLFALRYALMEHIIKEGLRFPTWRVFTKGSGKTTDIWAHVLSLQNWVPEIQQLMNHSIAMAMIRGRGLDRAFKEMPGKDQEPPTVELAKGGFGAGKTFFLKVEYGDAISGVIGSDRMKGEIRKLFPGATSDQVHIQSSVLANAIYDALLTSGVDRIVYDSAMTDPTYLASFVLKAQETGKSIVINDIVRTDMVRALGVLNRKIGGEDPNIPALHVLNVAAEEYATRLQCLALAVIPKMVLGPDSAPHTIEYCLYIGDEKGGFAEHGIRIRYQADPKEKRTIEYLFGSDGLPDDQKIQIKEMIDQKLRDFGIPLTPEEMLEAQDPLQVEERKKAKRQELCREFKRPVCDVMTGPQSQQQTLIETCERRELVAAGLPHSCSSWADFVSLVANPELRSAFNDALLALQKSGADVFPEWKDQKKIQEKLSKGEKITYLDLPLVLALETNSHLKREVD